MDFDDSLVMDVMVYSMPAKPSACILCSAVQFFLSISTFIVFVDCLIRN